MWMMENDIQERAPRGKDIGVGRRLEGKDNDEFGLIEFEVCEGLKDLS